MLGKEPRVFAHFTTELHGELNVLGIHLFTRYLRAYCVSSSKIAVSNFCILELGF